VQDSTERSVSIEENLLVPSRRLCRPANISALAPSTGVPKIAEMKATQCYWVFPVHIVLLLDAFVSMLIMENTISTFLIISAGRIEIVSRALYAKNINPVQSTGIESSRRVLLSYEDAQAFGCIAVLARMTSNTSGAISESPAG